MITKNIILPIALMLVIVAGPLAYASTTATPQQQQEQQQVNTKENVIETKNVIQESVEGVNGVEIDTRWSPPGEVQPDKGIALLLVECPPGEIPENPQFILAENVLALQSARIGIDAENLAWMMIVQNYGENAQWVKLGADCNDVPGDDDSDDDQVTTNIDITNIVKFINKNIVINKNITIIGNGTNGNGTVVIPPPGGNNTNGNTTDPGTGGNTTDPGTGGGGNTTDPGTGSGNNTTAALEEPETFPPGASTGGEEPTLPINETSSQPELLQPIEPETTPSTEEEEETTAGAAAPPAPPTETETETPPTEEETETEETTTTEETETTTSEEPTSQIEEQEENPEQVVE